MFAIHTNKVSESEARSSFPEMTDEEISAFCKEFNSTGSKDEAPHPEITYEAAPCLNCAKHAVVKIETLMIDGCCIEGNFTFCQCCRFVMGAAK